MSISTSLTNLNLVYPSTSSDNQWNQDYNVPRNEQQFIVNEQYNVNPVSSGSSTYTNPKIPNMNCPTGQMNFNPPSYSSYNPNGLNGQDIRFQNTYNTCNSGVMFHGSRATQFMPGPSTSYSPARRIVSRPTWSTSKSTSGGVKKTKRIRTAFTSQQMMELENEYARARYLDRSRRIELSEVLKLHERTIKIWFQNRRMKEKKDKNEAAEEAEATSTTESSPEIAAPMIMYDPYANNGVGFDRNVYVEQYPVPSMAHNDVPSVVENIANLHINPYPAFVVENNMPVSDFDMQCRQINMQLQNYSIDDKDDAFQQETLEESSTSENSTIGTSKNSDESENWDLSWIRSIHIDDDA